MPFLLCLLSEELHRQPRAVYKYWAPCRAGLSLRSLVPDSHLFAVLGSTVDTIYVSLLWLLWEQRQVRTVLTVLVSRDSTDAVPEQGVLELRSATTGAGFRPDIPVVAQRQFPMVHLFMLLVQFSDKVFDVFTIPLNGWTIVATATVVTSCSSSGVCPVWGGLRRDVVWWWRFYS